MADIALVAANDPVTGYPSFDVSLTPVPSGAVTFARDVQLDAGLSTAVYISLFTDARADGGSADPNDLRGWWGDEFGQAGSQLWRLINGKATDEAVDLAKTYAEDALAWMVDAGIAASVSATVSRIGLYAISIVIQIQEPDTKSSTFRYALNWAATG